MRTGLKRWGNLLQNIPQGLRFVKAAKSLQAAYPVPCYLSLQSISSRNRFDSRQLGSTFTNSSR